MSVRRRWSRGERGAVTAELALGLPLVLAVTVGLVWLLAAARDVAQRIAPTGATIEMVVEGGRVAVTASAEVAGPGGLFDFLPGVTVRSRAVAVLEDA